MKNYIETRNMRKGKARAILSVAVVFSLVWAAAFRQTDTAAVSAQSSNDAPVSPQSGEQTFFNSSQIVINDNAVASPYPSTITVSGVNPATVTKVRVNISGLAHSYPDDVDIVLVGPQGQRAVLMSDAGGNPDLNNVTLQFDQQSSNVLPDSSAISTGVYRPTNYANDTGTLTDTFPAPGPGTLTDAPADLSVFNFINPNGDWKLYVVDDAAQDAGTIVDGWTLILTVPQVFTVNSAADTTDGVCDAANCTLREAITVANAGNGGDLINFNFSILQTINLLTALPEITKSITIQGPGAGLLTVRRDASVGGFRIFSIASGIAGGVAISGMTVTGGNGGNDAGGGIYSDSNLTLTNVHVTGNTANTGAGVTLGNGSGTFTNCTFNNNSANAWGGGIYFQNNSGQTLRLINSTISGNQSQSNEGGGIRHSSLDADSRLEITNSTIANNSGGGISAYAQGSSGIAATTLRNSIIVGNTPNNLTKIAIDGSTATYITNGFNLSDNFNGVFTPAATDITTATPRLAPLAFYRGSTPTHALAFGSPAIDAGNNSGSGVTTDQTGVNRTVDLPSITNAANSDGTDIGAFEAQTAPAAPIFSINDVSQNEGSQGTTDFIFTVTLSAPNGQPVSVNYQTAEGTATPNSDYTAISSATLNFAANETTKQITVVVNGDQTPEPNETFFVNLSNASGAIIGDFQGLGTIVNDDIPPPAISIANVSQSEGNSGTSNFNFTVSLSAASSQTVTVGYTTTNGTANSGSDYTATGGTLTFAPNETSKNVAVVVNGDTIVEPDETFFVNLFSATNATIANTPGQGTIQNDDGSCTYTLSPTSPQSVGAAAGNLTVIVNAPTGCPWTSASNSGFLTVTSGTSGNGDGNTQIAIAANTGAARSGTLTIANQTYTINQAAATTARARFDFDGDGKADVSVFRPSNGVWYLQQSTAGFTGVAFGASDDIITPADFDGDGKTDIAVFRPSNGVWYLQQSTAGFTGIAFGTNGDIPMPADYDGDGKADLAVFRPGNGVWYIQQSTSGFVGIAFGASGDVPVAADYDGDGKADIAVFRPSNGTWYIQRSQLGFTGVLFGVNSDKPVPADYDGDGKTDIAVFRPSNGTWYLQQSTIGFNGILFGSIGDLPVPADYDGDGKSDVAVFRPSNGVWYLNRSTQGFTGISFGASTDKPIPNAFVQ